MNVLPRCIFCFAKNMAEIRFDKHNKPFFYCRACQTRAFVRGLEAVRGFAVLPLLLVPAIDRMATDPAWAERFNNEIASMMEFVRSSKGPSAPAQGISPVVGEVFEETSERKSA